MKTYKLVLIGLMIILLLNMTMIGGQRILLPDILPPQTMEIDSNNIYLACGTTVSTISISDFKLNKTFGKKGEGPGEFIRIEDDMGMTLSPIKEGILINSNGKISYFTPKGVFIREQRAKNGNFLKPLSENFVGINFKIDNKILYNITTIYDKNFNIIKELYRKKNWFQRNQKIDPVNVKNGRFRLYKDLVFTDNDKNGISIFNKNGTLLNQIKIDFNKRKITEAEKKSYHNYYKTHPAYKELYANLKHLLVFPEYFPAIQYFDVSNSKLYIFTYIQKGDTNEIYVFDLEGKLIKKKYIKMAKISYHEVYPLIRVKNEKIYQIVESLDDEDQLELIITDLKIN